MDAPDAGPLVARVPQSHFRRWRLLQDWKWFFTAAVALLVGGWWLTRFFAAERHAAGYAPGDLSRVHATWDDHCEACHESFKPLTSHSWLGFLPGSEHGTGAASRHCTVCHAGPAHQPNVLRPGAEADCGACHNDHRGRDASLVRVSDEECLRCHRSLSALSAVSLTPIPKMQAVTGFVGKQHPQFALFATTPPTDPGKLKEFDHALHLTPGIAVKDSKNPKKLSDLDKEDRSRYQRDGQDDDALVRLDCASCHQLDSGDRKRQPADLDVTPPTPPRSSGAYMLPISYEDHCRACHPLTFDGMAGARVPHRLQPPALRPFLNGFYQGRHAAALPALAASLIGLAAGDPPALSILTNVAPDRVAAFVPAAATVWTVAPLIRPDHPEITGWERAALGVRPAVERAERRLYRGGQACDKCHAFQGGEGPLGVPTAVVPTALPSVWFAKAKFDHVAHRASSCRDCHAPAYPDEPNASHRSTDVLVASAPQGKFQGVELCQRCHAPAASHNADAPGGAGFRCTECHAYHHGDQPLQGRGARARAPDPPP